MTHDYDDIINLPHPTSKCHQRMSMYQRAAQFAPFAALTGHGAAINETARQTDSMLELSESEKRKLDNKFYTLLEHIREHPSISVTHFVPDTLKSGGRYVTYRGTVRKWDEYDRALIFEDGTVVRLPFIIDIAGSDIPS